MTDPDQAPQGSPATRRFAIRVDPQFRGLFVLFGAGRRHDYVQIGAGSLTVRLGWLFRAEIPSSTVIGVHHHADMVGGWGAHGWRNRWLVNGSSRGIVEVDLGSPQQAWVAGFWPVRLRTLYVSLEDPGAFLRETAIRAGPAPRKAD
ncbi:MAG TPA: hypothetical protein VMU76_10120 [Acidimicrobiales bacterium]|nr:hypothetical protein [Acidimicrobiales bacterium]